VRHALSSACGGHCRHLRRSGPRDLPKTAEDPKPIGGHATAAVGWDPDYLYIATWDSLTPVTWPFVSKYLSEVHVTVSRRWINTKGHDAGWILLGLPRRRQAALQHRGRRLTHSTTRQRSGRPFGVGPFFCARRQGHRSSRGFWHSSTTFSA
jgi:hypothetical protein